LTNEELAQHIQQGDNGYMPQLWEQVRRFIAGQALRLYNALEDTRGIEPDDLIQQGYFAVVAAVRYYDPARGLKFATYLTRTLKTAFAEALGRRGSKRDALLQARSLDEPLDDSGEYTLLDTIGDRAGQSNVEEWEESAYNRDLREALDNALDYLNDRHRQEIRRHYYFGQTYDSIGKLYGVNGNAVVGDIDRAFIQIRKSSHRRKLASFMPYDPVSPHLMRKNHPVVRLRVSR